MTTKKSREGEQMRGLMYQIRFGKGRAIWLASHFIKDFSAITGQQPKSVVEHLTKMILTNLNEH